MPQTISRPTNRSRIKTEEKPRVLMLTHRFPYPPNRGDRIRSYNLMRVLCESFDVTLACPHDEPIASNELAHVESLCEGVITESIGRTRWVRAAASVSKGGSLTEGLFRHRSISREVLSVQRTHSFDAILVFCSSMFPYVDHVDFQDTPMIVDLVDVDSEKWRQLAADSALPKSRIYDLEYSRVRALEQRIADRADAITLVSEDEAKLFRSLIPTKTPILGVSNGVDTEYFRPKEEVSSLESRVAREEIRTSHPPLQGTANECSHTRISHPPLQGGSNVARGGSSEVARSEERGASEDRFTSHSQLATSHLIFTGVLDYPPNVEGMRWFCESILPELRKRLDVQLNIVGRRPNQTIKQLGELAGVNLIGEVPDVRPHLHQADIAISPLKLARGIQNKVLEAMACGLPVVTTTESAEGIEAISGNHFVIADDEVEWVESLCRLADDEYKCNCLGKSARELVVDHYAWPARMAHITNLLNQHLTPRL